MMDNLTPSPKISYTINQGFSRAFLFHPWWLAFTSLYLILNELLLALLQLRWLLLLKQVLPCWKWNLFYNHKRHKKITIDRCTFYIWLTNLPTALRFPTSWLDWRKLLGLGPRTALPQTDANTPFSSFWLLFPSSLPTLRLNKTELFLPAWNSWKW